MNWDYVAGLFDGEGTVVLHNGGRPTWLRPMIAISITDKELLEQVQRFIKLGNRLLYKYRGKNKPMWQWQVTNRWDCLKFAKKIVNKCIIKREKLKKLIDLIQKHDYSKSPWKLMRCPSLKQKLERWYVEENRSMAEIARKLKVVPSTARYHLRRFGIPLRNYKVKMKPEIAREKGLLKVKEE